MVAKPIEVTIEIGDTTLSLSQVVEQVADGEARIVVAQDGQPVAAIISAEEYQRFKEQERERARFELTDAFTRISDAFRDVPEEELERELAKAREEYRAEKRAEREAAAHR